LHAQEENAFPVSNPQGVTYVARAFIPLVLVCSAFFSVWAQSRESQGCSVGSQFEPTVVSNLKAEVTVVCRDATGLELIESIGHQTRIPIGVVLGKDPDLLAKTRRNYRLFNVGAKSALLEAVTGTGYTVGESDAGFLITAGDLTSRQSEVLGQKLLDFGARSNATMVELGSQLTMWLQSAVDHPQGFGGGILYSTNDERFTLQALPPLTVQQIADGIVSLGSKGIWILTTDPVQRTSEWTDAVKIEPYQHYSNLPTTDD
jgi:hypothetical protein